MKEYKKGDVLRINPKKGVKTWCRHHTYIHNGEGFADTYWTSGTYIYSLEELQELAVEVYDLDQNMDDFDQIPHAVYENDVTLYAKRDRIFIPMGGGHERSLIRKGAEPIKERVIFQLNREIDERIRKAGWLLGEAQERRRLLESLQTEGVDE